MELALNVAWLVITIAAFGFFSLRIHENRGEVSRATAWMALACVVCLLFPVISMTDDLNSSPALPEATKLKNLLLCTQVVIGLLSHVPAYSTPERMWSGAAFQLEHNNIQQQFLSFDLNRRPPPFLQVSLT